MAKAQAVELKGALQKCADDADALVILKQLAEVKMDVDILTSTAVGLTVNTYRKSENVELSNLAKTLVSTWKKIAVGAKGSPAAATSKPASKTSTAKTTKKGASSSSSNTSKTTTKSTSNNKDSGNDDSALPIPLPKPGDIRSVVQEKLCSILEAGDDIQKKKIACEIEEHMFVKNDRETGQRYREHSRSILFNLRDPKNPDLKRELLEGSLTPYDLVRRSPEELASADQRKRIREAFENAVARARTDWEDTQEEHEATWCDMFQCPKCNERKTKFKQKQIRSADEPMTTFIVCGNCQYRWTDN